ncbi:MAG TPA: GAF domain-containing protein [Cellvibrio sp.]|nr:GAF domain-containing protein [Cellvibrio sp.]
MPNITSILQTIQANTTPDWDKVLSETLSTFACPTGTLHRLESASQLLQLVAQRGLPDFLLPMVGTIPVGKGMAGICAERRDVVQTCNLQTDTSGVVRPGAKETKMEGAITVPILNKGELLGTLGIAKPVPYDFSEEETAALVAISNAIAATWVH